MSSKGVKKKTGDNEAGGEYKKLKTAFYEKQLFELQVELCKLQEWVKQSGTRAFVLFEGRDRHGKSRRS